MTTAINDELRAKAVDMIRSLASNAGDEDRIMRLLKAFGSRVDYDEAVAVCTAALVLTFSECVRKPTPLDMQHPVPITIP